MFIPLTPDSLNNDKILTVYKKQWINNLNLKTHV